MLGTTFNEYDQSQIEEIEEVAPAADDAVVVLSAAATKKGTETLGLYSSNEFISMFGEADFTRFGQVSIQNEKLVKGGAKILFQRLVADDARLANLVLVASLYQTEAQKTNKDGQLIYHNPETDTETTDATRPDTVLGGANTLPNDPVMVPTAHILYEAESVTDAVELADIKANVADYLDEAGQSVPDPNDPGETVTMFTYPIMYFVDNGRGESNKRIAIQPENALSKNLDFMYYTLKVYEEGALIEENCLFSAIPQMISNKECIDLTSVSESKSLQVVAGLLDEEINKFYTKVAELSELDIIDLQENDPLFGTNRKGLPLGSVVVDDINGIELNTDIGIELASGTDGSFTDSPAKNATTLYYEKMAKFYKGEMNDDVFNVDKYFVSACFDAAFPVNVKQAIFELADWRKDMIYFRDYELGCKNLVDIEKYRETLPKSSYVADFCQVYDITDPITLKTARVTQTYSYSQIILEHLHSNGHLPFAGERYGAIITDIKSPNSLNFAPKKLPTVDQKSEMEDLRVNFGSYFENNFVMETLYTSQEKYTQLSFINNRFAVNQVVMALRKHFPAVRYQFVTSIDDIESYAADVNAFLSPYTANFAELKFDYSKEIKYLNNKIFKATLKYRFNNFIQAESIDAYLLPTESLAGAEE